MTDYKPTVCVDLDGTLIEETAWRGYSHFGKPYPGAQKFTHDLGEKYYVVIYTARIDALGELSDPAMKAVKEYLDHEGFYYDDIRRKEVALCYIDDRAVHAYPEDCDDTAQHFKHRMNFIDSMRRMKPIRNEIFERPATSALRKALFTATMLAITLLTACSPISVSRFARPHYQRTSNTCWAAAIATAYESVTRTKQEPCEVARLHFGKDCCGAPLRCDEPATTGELLELLNKLGLAYTVYHDLPEFRTIRAGLINGIWLFTVGKGQGAHMITVYAAHETPVEVLSFLDPSPEFVISETYGGTFAFDAQARHSHVTYEELKSRDTGTLTPGAFIRAYWVREGGAR